MSEKINIKDKIKNRAAQLLPEIIALRRHIHSNPELSKQEFKTCGYISERLTEYGIPHKKGIASTGVIALIEGKNSSSRVVALRADMDALPVKEANNKEYKSKHEGVMHACGHDAHVACLLGAARILNEIKNDFEGSVKLIFQPSEEKYPGGAITLINEGVLKNPKVDYIIGMHVFPSLETGVVGMKSGKYMASTDEIFITVKGKGGHAATPELVIDPVLIGSLIVVALQQVVSRNATPTIPSVLSFGQFLADGITNVIPDTAKIAGTFRTYDEKWRSEAHEKIKKIATSIAESMGASCDVTIDKGYPFLINDEELTYFVREKSGKYLGEKNVKELEMRMTSEDFAYFSQYIPSCFFRLGVRNEKKGITSNLHTSTFDIDEDALETGAGLMAWLAVNNFKL